MQRKWETKRSLLNLVLTLVVALVLSLAGGPALAAGAAGAGGDDAYAADCGKPGCKAGCKGDCKGDCEHCKKQKAKAGCKCKGDCKGDCKQHKGNCTCGKKGQAR
jgi:hypothetical protein